MYQLSVAKEAIAENKAKAKQQANAVQNAHEKVINKGESFKRK